MWKSGCRAGGGRDRQAGSCRWCTHRRPSLLVIRQDLTNAALQVMEHLARVQPESRESAPTANSCSWAFRRHPSQDTRAICATRGKGYCLTRAWQRPSSLASTQGRQRMKAEMTGKCWCGCGKDTGSFFAPGCDRRVQEALLDMVCGSGTTADRLARLGYGPNNSIIESRNRLNVERRQALA